ncbi:MAG: ATP-binding cassette domain-containing protein [Candidatus Hydrogenedentes bacterium]|nr:ATP-binding cassette domain-containing protein [Candidatus Hydrogenedentota bacterium]
MIEVKGITKYYGAIPAVNDVSFKIAKGEIVGFLGPNGAGKTTTMRILTGYSPPSAGYAKIDGFSIVDQPLEVKRRVGYLPESVPIYPEMVVARFLHYVGEVKGLAGKARRIEVDRVIDRCGLREMAKRLVGNLSKGYRQRVGLAQALLGDPPVLILDEPTVGLDPRQIIEIRQVIKELAEKHTVLLSTHILPEVSMLCRRVIIIHRGRIVTQDTMENLESGQGLVVELETAGPKDGVKRALQPVSGVKEVKALGQNTYRIALATPETRDAIAAALMQAGYPLKELKVRKRTLEDIFVEATTGDAGEAA